MDNSLWVPLHAELTTCGVTILEGCGRLFELASREELTRPVAKLLLRDLHRAADRIQEALDEYDAAMAMANRKERV
jgi:hypothetical protein